MDGMTVPAGTRMGPVCGVVAVAAAAGVDFDTAWRVMEPLARVYLPAACRRGWNGLSTSRMREKALQQLGVGFHTVRFPRMQLRTFAEHARPGVLYMVRTTGHVQMVRNGSAMDQGGVRSISRWNGMDRKLVSHVIEIEGR